jgi:hypothetical protein
VLFWYSNILEQLLLVLESTVMVWFCHFLAFCFQTLHFYFLILHTHTHTHTPPRTDHMMIHLSFPLSCKTMGYKYIILQFSSVFQYSSFHLPQGICNFFSLESARKQFDSPLENYHGQIYLYFKQMLTSVKQKHRQIYS